MSVCEFIGRAAGTLSTGQRRGALTRAPLEAAAAAKTARRGRECSLRPAHGGQPLRRAPCVRSLKNPAASCCRRGRIGADLAAAIISSRQRARRASPYRARASAGTVSAARSRRPAGDSSSNRFARCDPIRVELGEMVLVSVCVAL